MPELSEGWLIYNVHGLDGEGWGPMRSEYFDRLLDRLVAIDSVRVVPAGEVLNAPDNSLKDVLPNVDHNSTYN